MLKHPHVSGIPLLSWSVIQLNRAFGSRDGVHIQLARVDHRVLAGPWRTQDERQSGPELGARRQCGRCISVMVSISGSHLILVLEFYN